MNMDELKEAIRLKTMEFEIAMETGRPHEELMQIYKELKELQYRKVQAELNEPEQG